METSLMVIKKTYKWLFNFIISERQDDIFARATTCFFMFIIVFILFHFAASMFLYIFVLITDINLSDVVRYIFFTDAFLVYNEFGILFLWPFLILVFTFMGKLIVMGKNFPQ
jgi:hypothetical protein